VFFGELLVRLDHSVHVGLHEVGHEVDILVPCAGGRFLDIEERHDIVVVEELEQLDLTLDAFSVYQVFEGLRNLLDRHFALGDRV